MTGVRGDGEVAQEVAARLGSVAHLVGTAASTTPSVHTSLANALGPIGAAFAAAFLAAADRHSAATADLARRLGDAGAATAAAHRSYDESQQATVTALRGSWR